MSSGAQRSGRKASLTFRLLAALTVASLFLSLLVALIGAEQSERRASTQREQDQLALARSLAWRAAPLLEQKDELRLAILASAAADVSGARVLLLDARGVVRIDTALALGQQTLPLQATDGPRVASLDDIGVEAIAPALYRGRVVGEARLRSAPPRLGSELSMGLFGAAFLVSLSLIAVACMFCHQWLARIAEAATVAQQLARGEHRAQCRLRGADVIGELQDSLKDLGKTIEQGAASAELGVLELASKLVESLEQRGQVPPGHGERTWRYARILCERLGLRAEDRRDVELAAHLHDLGKVAVRTTALNKSSPLDEAERASLRAHPETGARLLECVPALERVAGIVRHHHEKFDGSGYPEGRRGDRIPLGARIVAIADAYDVLTSQSYRGAPLTWAQALELLREDRGTHFDPWLLDLFEEVVRSAPVPARPVAPVVISAAGVFAYKAGEEPAGEFQDEDEETMATLDDLEVVVEDELEVVADETSQEQET